MTTTARQIEQQARHYGVQLPDRQTVLGAAASHRAQLGPKADRVLGPAVLAWVLTHDLDD